MRTIWCAWQCLPLGLSITFVQEGACKANSCLYCVPTSLHPHYTMPTLHLHYTPLHYTTLPSSCPLLPSLPQHTTPVPHLVHTQHHHFFLHVFFIFQKVLRFSAILQWFSSAISSRRRYRLSYFNCDMIYFKIVTSCVLSMFTHCKCHQYIWFMCTVNYWLVMPAKRDTHKKPLSKKPVTW